MAVRELYRLAPVYFHGNTHGVENYYKLADYILAHD